MRYEVKIGDRVGYDATTGDRITYQHNGETITAMVTETYPNAIVFETTDGRLLHASYDQLVEQEATYSFVRSKNPLLKF